MTVIYKLSGDRAIDRKLIQVYHKWLKTADEFCLTKKAKNERKEKTDSIIEDMRPIIRDILVSKGYDTTKPYEWTVTKCSMDIYGRGDRNRADNIFIGLVVEEVY